MVVSKKTLRYYWWFVQEYSKKHARLILLSFLLSFFLLVAVISFSPFLSSFLSSTQNTVGMVGNFDFRNLPDDVTNKISNGLLFENEKGQFIPALATSWEIKDDGKRYRVHLKRGLSWNDSKPFSARDVHYDFQDVEIKPIDESTVDFILKKPLATFPVFMTRPIIRYPLIGVVGLWRVDKVKSKYGNIQEVSLSPNKKDLPHITYKFYDTESKLINAYKRGEIREMNVTNKEVAEQFKKWKNTTVTQSVDYSRVLTLFMNTKSGPLADKDTRKAIHLAIPQLPLQKSGELADSPIPPTSWAYNTQLKNVLYDKDAAEKTLRKVFEDKSAKPLNFITFYDYIDQANVINDSLQEVGVKTNLKLNAFAGSGDFDLLLAFWKVPQDPDQYFFWHSTQSQGNITGMKNVKIDKLLEDGRNNLNPKTRTAIYHDFQKVMADETPAIFLYYPYVYTVKRK